SDATSVHGPVGVFAPSSVKVIGSRSGASFAVARRRPSATLLPATGVTIKPVLSLSKLRYFVFTFLSPMCQTCSAAGLLVEKLLPVTPKIASIGSVLRAGLL